MHALYNGEKAETGRPMRLEVEAIRAFADNYIWALHDNRRCVLVDPGEPDGPLAFLRQRSLELAGLLLTHHHHDHVGGVDAIRARHPAPAWGPDDARMPGDLQRVGEGDDVRIEALDLRFDVIETPGHTASHIAFHGHGMLLCGDTLFSAGCGRLFEGDPEQMQASLDKLAALPDDTRVYCAHEYTQSNCRFAQQVEPDNRALARRRDEVDELRRRDRITLPSRLGDEKAYNPFLRTREPSVIRAAARRDPGAGTDPASVFGVIRAWKDAV
jgi:hydroxyacylglutathione hydrolase